MGYIIANDDGVAENHHAKLTDGGDLVPAGSIIELVHGDGAEPASLEFLQRLKDAAAMVGAHTDAVRAAVKQNAEALKAAAESLKESDEASAAELSATHAIIDQTAADTTHEDVQASQTFLSEESAADESAAQTASAPASSSGSSYQSSAAGPKL